MAPTTRPLALALALCGLALQPGALAQIASPINAGGNAGNNSIGASTTSAATPNFTFGLPTLTAEQQQELEESFQSSLTQPEAEPLAPLLSLIPRRQGVDLASLSLAQGLIPASVTTQPAAQIAELTSQLTASGIEPNQASQLVALMQSLAQKPTLTQLSDAINLFNRILTQSTPDMRASLRQNPVFVAIGATLRSARAVVGS